MTAATLLRTSAFVFIFLGTIQLPFAQCMPSEWTTNLFNSPNHDQNDSRRPLTHLPENTHWLELNSQAFLQTRKQAPDQLTTIIPGPDGGKWTLTWKRFSAYRPDLKISRMTAEGQRVEPYLPQLRSYALDMADASGSLIIMENEVICTFTYKGVGYEITPIEGDLYALFPLQDVNHGLTFTCGVSELAEHGQAAAKVGQSKSAAMAECVEIALDVDHHTYNLFGSDCYAAVEWALALLSGVHVIYDAELDDLVDLQATYVNVWETVDPYAAVTNNGGGVLDAFRVEWATNPDLVGIPRDMTHLLTRRTNTGTGGIAYLDVTCWTDYAFGLSSYLNGGLTYIPGTYAWNLNVVAHEFGHNFGSNHTHWCGWSSGPIDNCYDLEGSCGGYTNNVTAQVGTIMSYCHAIAGGSVNLQFHPTVESEALIPTINSDGSCLGGCASFSSNCSYYGCTDSAACNYDAEAVEDDGSCSEFDSCGICGGDGTACIGCSDEVACNYSDLVTTDDGSCIYGPAGGPCDCGDQVTLAAELSGGMTESTILSGSGYISSLEVTLDFTYMNDQSWASEVILFIESPNGDCIEIGGYQNDFGCGSSSSWPAAWSVGVGGVYSASITLLQPLEGIGDWTFGIGNGWLGSVNAGYALEVVPDQFCAFELIDGCTDATACNYEAIATVDNGTCIPAPCGDCVGDLNGDGFVSIADVLIILSDFGCASECSGDLNGDGSTNINDMLLMLSVFGVPC